MQMEIVDTLQSLGLSFMVVGVIVIVYEYKRDFERCLSLWLTLIGSIFILASISLKWYIGEFDWIDVIMFLLFINGVRLDVINLFFKKE